MTFFYPSLEYNEKEIWQLVHIVNWLSYFV